MTRASVFGGFLAAGLGALAGPASAQSVDVVHYWTSKSESRTINILADAYKAKGGRWIDSAVANFDEAVAVANSRIAGGTPPSAILMNPGSTLDEMTEAGYMRDLGDIAEREGWSKVVPPFVLEKMTSNDQIVAVPLGLHGANWLWYSKKIFDEAKVAPPRTWPEFLEVADKIKAAGYVPLAVGGENWQINYIMSSILSGLGGPDFYQKLYVEHDPAAAASPVVAEGFETLRKLQAYVDEGSVGRSWNETTGLLVTDRAAMQFIGDYVKGEFSAAGKVAGTDYGCVLAPGTEGMYQVYTDLMTITAVDDPDVVKGQDLLVAAVLDPKVEVDMSRSKGSTPGRSDVVSEGLDPCARLGSESLAGARKVFSGPYETLSSDQMGQVTDLVGQFWTDRSMTAEDAATRFAAIFP